VINIDENVISLYINTTSANIVVIWIKKLTAKAKIKQMVKGRAYAIDISRLPS